MKAIRTAIVVAGLLLATATGLLATATGAAANPERWKAEGWKTDFSRHSVPFSQILSGGPQKDGIPSIDDPRFVSARDEKTLGEREPVIRLAIGGDVRAYPLRILIWHEIVNDVVGGLPVAVTYCPLCNSAIAFDRRIEGKAVEFGTTGLLRNSDLVMYDRESESWWQQFTGEAIVGKHTGRTLTMIPTRVEAFGRFRRRSPEAKVLVPNDPGQRPYGRNPYVAYDSRARPYPLYDGALPDDVPAMARVVVVREGGRPRGVLMSLLRKKGRMMLGDVELSWQAGQNSALDSAEIASGRDVGAVRAVRISADGKRKEVIHDVTFAFVFHAFHPDADLVKE